jgi:hypothetical protein
MKKKLLFLLLFSGLIFYSCKKDKEVDTVTTTDPTINISGITWRDITGELMAQPDTTDWRSYDNLCQTEKNLFVGGSFLTNSSFTDSIFIAAYPNPTKNRFNLYVKKDSTIKSDYLIVNQRFQKIYSAEINHDTVTNEVIFLDNIAPALSDTIFRIYYRFTNKSNFARFGHGDVIRKK